MTIHKAQGLSLDYVDLNFTDRGFAAGMMYVALSRCKSYRGLHCSCSAAVDSCKSDPQARGFYAEHKRGIRRPKPPEEPRFPEYRMPPDVSLDQEPCTLAPSS